MLKGLLVMKREKERKEKEKIKKSKIFKKT